MTMQAVRVSLVLIISTLIGLADITKATEPIPARQEVTSARDENSRLWKVTHSIADAREGEPNQRISYIHEKGCGICYKNAQGNWQITDTSWRASGDGFVMNKANYSLSIGPTANSWLSYTVRGKNQRLRPVSAAMVAGETKTTIAQLQSASHGVIDSNSPNKLIFANAFGPGIDLEYIALPGGYHQNIVFKTKPQISGIDANTAKFIITTEIDGTQSDLAVQTGSSKTLVSALEKTAETSSSIGFTFEQDGKAQRLYTFGNSNIFQTRAGKKTKLGAATKCLSSNKITNKLVLEETLDAKSLAEASYPLVWDYQTVSSVIEFDDYWYADATYYISSGVSIAQGITLYIEPGTIIKSDYYCAVDASAGGRVVAVGKPYNYIFFTGAYDNTVGEIVHEDEYPGYGEFGDWGGLMIGSDSQIQFCKINNPDIGINLSGNTNMTISNNIISGACEYGVYLYGSVSGGTIEIFNNLITSFGTGIEIVSNGPTVNIRNNTIKATVGIIGYGYSGGPGIIKNNLFCKRDDGVYGIELMNYSVSSPWTGENHNAFYNFSSGHYIRIGNNTNVTPDESDVTAFTGSPFDTDHTQLGSYFLKKDSNGDLLKNAGDGDTADYFTDPHQWSIYAVSDTGYLFTSSTNLTANTEWSPNYNSTCDTDTVAIGYHHPRVDYCLLNTVNVGAVNFTIQPGTVVAMGGNSTSYGNIVLTDTVFTANGLPFEQTKINLVYLPYVAANWFLTSQNHPSIIFYPTTTSSQNQSSLSFINFTALGEVGIVGTQQVVSLAIPIHDCAFRLNCNGGLILDSCNAAVRNCLFLENALSGIWAGATVEQTTSTVTVVNCDFDRNVNGVQIGAYGATQICSVTNCIFTNQHAASNHAGIYVYDGDPIWDGLPSTVSLTETYNGFYKNDYHIRYYSSGTPVTPGNTDLAGLPSVTGRTELQLANFYSGWTDFADRFYLPQSNNQLINGGDQADGLMYGYTTDPVNGAVDSGRRDIGYHYPTSDYADFWQIRVPRDYGTIQAAINASANGDVIVVDPGIYYDQVIAFGSKKITLQSTDPAHPERTKLLGDGYHPVITVGTDSTIKGFRIENQGYLMGFDIYDYSISCSGSSPTIENCMITNSYGIYCHNGTAATIKGCIITATAIGTYAAIHCDGAGTATIINNLICNTPGICITNGSAQVKIRNNTIVNNDGGIYLDSSTAAIVSNNIIRDNAAYGNLDGLDDVSYCCLNSGDTFLDKHNITPSDPGFVDAAHGDYHLLSTSPCIDAGDPATLLTAGETDLYGGSRIRDIPAKGNTDIDIGADEYSRIYVKTTGNAGNDGLSWATAKTLSSALSVAQSGDEIWVAAGEYKPTGIGRAATFKLPENVTLYGRFAGVGDDSLSDRSAANITTLSGDIDTSGNQDCYHVVQGSDIAIIDGFIICGGRADGAYPNNKGGGIDIPAGVSKFSVRNCVIKDNYAIKGGGIACEGSSLEAINCVIANNTASSSGGGLSCLPYYPFCRMGLVHLVNCTIAGNSAGTGTGGGIKAGPAQFLKIENSIIYFNTAASYPNFDNSYSLPGLLPHNPTIISHSDIAGCGGSPDTGGTWNSSFGLDGGGNIQGNPLFVDTSIPTLDLDGTDNTMFTSDDGLQLRRTSPCINAGDNLAISDSYDIADWYRKWNNIVDIGAYEYRDFSPGGEAVYFSGLTAGDGQYGSSVAFGDDYRSDILQPGFYPDAWEVLTHTNPQSLDGIAVHEGTRVRIWTDNNYGQDGGDLVLDVCGPALIENAYWGPNHENYSDYTPIMTANFEDTDHDALQAEFPPTVRYWSDDAYVHPEGDGCMHHDGEPTGLKQLAVWGKGSIVIDAAP